MSDTGGGACDGPTEDLADLYENAPSGYLSLDRRGRVVKVNQTLATWLGVSKDDLLGRRLLELLNVAGAMFYETHFAPLLRMQGFFHEVALDFVKSDGKVLPTLANAVERRDAEGNVLFTRVTIFQASDRRRYERALVEAKEASDAARKLLEEGLMAERQTAELREQFVAVLGHDLRNPLAALNAGQQMLSRTVSDPAAQRVLRLMGESIARMSGLVENLMDLARGRLGGGIAITRMLQPLEPTLEQVADELRSSHPDHRIDLNLELPGPIAVDHRRIAQMFSNLLGNAVFHGAIDQPITVTASVSDDVFTLSVANGGEPIPPAVMSRLFQPFYRGEVRPSAQGLGLGLYIASQIAGAHGGKIDVSSDATETRFTFQMPMSSTDEPTGGGV